jgi:hypothetical protein
MVCTPALTSNGSTWFDKVLVVSNVHWTVERRIDAIDLPCIVVPYCRRLLNDWENAANGSVFAETDNRT